MNIEKIKRDFRRNKIAYMFIAPAAIVMIIIVGIPLISTIYYSFTNMSQKNFLFDKESIEKEMNANEEFLGVVKELKKLEKQKIQALSSGMVMEFKSYVGKQRDILKKHSKNPMVVLYSKLPYEGSGMHYLDSFIDYKGYSDITALENRSKININIANSLIKNTSSNIAMYKKKLKDGGIKFIWFKNYLRILAGADSDFWKVLWQTIVWTITNVFFHFVIGLWLALILNKRLRGNTIYRTLIMVPWAIPSFVVAFGWRLMFNYPNGFINDTLRWLGLTTSGINFLGDPSWMLPACILVNVWAGIPFMMITLLGGLQSIDENLYEAADIDGANKWQQFKHVTLPMLKPVSSVAVLLGVIWTFNMFNIIYLVTLGNEAVEKDIFVTYAYRAFRAYGDYSGAATYAVLILSILLAFGTYYIKLMKKDETM